MRYRKKPVVIEAMQFDGTMASYGAIQRWAGLAPGPDEFSIGGSPHDDPCGHTLSIPTLEGVMVANPGDWIIRGVGRKVPLRLPGPSLKGLDPVAVGAKNLTGMTFDLVLSRPDGLCRAEVDRFPVHVVDVEGYGVLAVAADDASALQLVRSDPVLHLTDAGVRLGVRLLAVAGVLQSVPAPGCPIGARRDGSNWPRSVLAEGRAEACIPSPCLESGAALSADEVVSHVGIIVPDFYPCKPDIFAATYEPAEECVGQFGDEPVTPWLPGVTPGRFNKETWAFQWDGSAASARELIAWVKTFSDMPAALLDPPGKMMIDGYTVRLGDYVIRNMEEYPHIVEKSAFEATYKLA